MNTRSSLILGVQLAVCALFSGIPAWSASFNITPIRVNWLNPQSTTALRISNTEEASVRVQLHAVRWTNLDGAEVYSDTDDVIVNPPILTIGGRRTQVVRLGLRSAVAAGTESTYRLFVEEVPHAELTGQGTVQTLLRLGIPIFVKPRSGTGPQTSWSCNRTGLDEVTLTVTNSGLEHEHFTKVQLTNDAQTLMNVGRPVYILAGERREFKVRLNPQERITQTSLTTQTVSGEQHQTLRITPD